ncbi:MAG: DUF1365 domain-containing protein [Oleispira sp.]
MKTETVALNSAVYRGDVRHRRFKPVSHEINHPIFMLYLDLDELPELFKRYWFFSAGKFNLSSFNRDDYLNPNIADLKLAVIDKVAEALGAVANEISSVRMLTNVRYCGHSFNPVTFYYCYNQCDKLLSIVAEITNTPWDERHCYVLPIASNFVAASASITYQLKGQGKHIFEFHKQFHVSPFNPMNMDYRWAFSEPQKSLHVHMDNYVDDTGEDAGDKHFDATLTLDRYEFNKAMPKVLFQYPFITIKVVIGIYWNALKLWLKRSPFYDHPGTANKSTDPSTINKNSR